MLNTIRTRWLSGILVLFWLTAAIHGQDRRIDPAGIDGSLLLCNDEVADAAVERFIRLAGGEDARIVIVATKAGDNSLSKRLSAAAAKFQAPAPKIHIVGAEAKLADTLREATGVWLTSGTPEKACAACQAVLRRSGIVAMDGAAAQLAPLHFLPDAVVLSRPSPQVRYSEPARLTPGVVVYKIGPKAGLLVKGRTLSAIGENAVHITLPGNDRREARTFSIQGKKQADLTALRRAARDRDPKHLFPPRKVAPPIVDKGTLVIVGGGGLPKGLFKQFIEYAGGAGKANIVIFPTAQPDPLPKSDRLAKIFRAAGARKATILRGRTLAEVDSKESLDTLKEATGIWFDGGRQWRFVDCYEDTKALPLMFDVLKRGGVIGGSSAGATIQGDYLCRGGVFDNFDMCYDGYERGLGFLKGVAIDQHFSQRKRHQDMTLLMKLYPQYLGIGLDEATAIVVKGQLAEVIGNGKAHFYDARRKVKVGQPDFEALPAGSLYDLRERRTLVEKK